MKIVMVLGKGRSGTTWLAHILNTYAHCAYKHEPFLPRKDTPYRAWKRALEQGGDPERLRQSFETLVRACIHGVDQPPFVAKSVRHQNPQLLQTLYGLGKRARAFRHLYEWYGRPHMHDDADVLIKDVNFPNELLPRLCQVLAPHFVPIVRNPFANIASHVRGVALGYFPRIEESDKERMLELLDAPDASHLRHYRDDVDHMTVLQLEALRWRLQVEPLIRFAESYPSSHLVVYEDLCAEPMTQTERLFGFLDWRMKDRTRRFIEASTAGRRNERSAERSFYTTFRDPLESMNKWREQLSAAQQAEIASVVADSPCMKLWHDLPL